MMALKALGYSMNTSDERQLHRAYSWLAKIVKTMKPEIVTDEIIDNMAQGRKALGLVYSGDAAYISQENKNIGFYMPKEGTNLWVDAMVLPKTCTHEKLAYAFMNYMNSYKAARANSKYVGYTSPVTKVEKSLAATTFKGNVAYTPRSHYKNDEVFEYNDKTRKTIADLWSRVKVVASNAH
jgi:spermidine/putrescine transport system permease protein